MIATLKEKEMQEEEFNLFLYKGRTAVLEQLLLRAQLRKSPRLGFMNKIVITQANVILLTKTVRGVLYA